MNGTPLGLQIDAVGMCCPVGLCAETACAAMRAGLGVIEELDELFGLDDGGEPIYGSYLSILETARQRERVVALLERGLADLGRRVSPGMLDSRPAILITRDGRPRTEQALLEVMPFSAGVIRIH